MKITTYVCAIMFAQFAFSQLSVRNSAYVYVQDQVVFVEDDVNIEENTAHIYLRDEAQLLQGNGTTGNSGIGKLSVYQNGTVHNYAYNYWCSPVGNIDSNTFLNRPFRPNNNIYDYIGDPDPELNPITSTLASYTTSYDGTSSPLVISSPWLYAYNPGTTYSEWDFIGSTGTVDAGYGFTMKGTIGSGYNQLYDFRGKPNNGTILTAVLNGQETLVGNPYPSALDAVDYIHDAVNSTLLDSGTLYFWEQDLSVFSHVLLDYRGGYASFTITSGGVPTFVPANFDAYNIDGTLNTGGGSSSSGKIVHRYIPIGQGFIIRGVGNGSVRTTNSMREYYKQSDPLSEFFRTPEAETSTSIYNDEGFYVVPEDFKRFRLNIDFNDTYTRQLLQNFHETATDGQDYGLESRLLEPLTSDSYWDQDGIPYVAQAFNFDEDLRIPIIVNLENQNELRFRLVDVQNFEDNQAIYLHDLEDDTYANLRVQSFEITLPEGSYPDQFEITFKMDNTLSTEEVVTLNDLNIFQNNNQNELTIVNPKLLDIKQVYLFDMNGKQVLNETNLPIKDKLTFSTQKFSEGTYIAKISFSDKQTLSKKIIVAHK